MSNFNSILYQKQAERIDKLNDIINELNAKNVALQQSNMTLSVSARYYTALTKIVDENPILRDDWVRFMTLVKLACDVEDLRALK
jgi:hypothetical protein